MKSLDIRVEQQSALSVHNGKRANRSGYATAAKLGPEGCEARSSKAGKACVAKYGPGFYAALARIAWKRHPASERRKKRMAARRELV